MRTGTRALQDVRHFRWPSGSNGSCEGAFLFPCPSKGVSPSCCGFVVKQCHCSFPLDPFRAAAQQCGVMVVPKHRSRGVLRRHLKFMVFRTPHSRVTPWRWNASGRVVISLSGTYFALLVSLISTLEKMSITFFTMIALSNGAVIR